MNGTHISVQSLGHICQLLQKPYGRVAAAAAELGMKPAVLLNGVAHYSDRQVELLIEHFNGQRDKRATRAR